MADVGLEEVESCPLIMVPASLYLTIYNRSAVFGNSWEKSEKGQIFDRMPQVG